MEEILENAEEFFDSGEDNIKKRRWNAAVSDFFKSISNFCDYLIYKEMRIFPKNHNERFEFLKKYFSDVYDEIVVLFKTYRDSYNLRLKKEDAEAVREYAFKLKKIVRNKK